jgi:predicted dehydrogenase
MWSDVPDNQPFANGFKAQWELFLARVHDRTPFAWDLLEGAKGVQLAELAQQSSAEGRRVDVPALEL